MEAAGLDVHLGRLRPSCKETAALWATAWQEGQVIEEAQSKQE